MQNGLTFYMWFIRIVLKNNYHFILKTCDNEHRFKLFIVISTSKYIIICYRINRSKIMIIILSISSEEEEEGEGEGGWKARGGGGGERVEQHEETTIKIIKSL